MSLGALKVTPLSIFENKSSKKVFLFFTTQIPCVEGYVSLRIIKNWLNYDSKLLLRKKSR
jgi:hypothetical protein